jgi:predicted AAA+ superfamily ATPase
MPATTRIPVHDILSFLPSAAPDAIEFGATATELLPNSRTFELDQHWLRGGYEGSLFADTDAASFEWRTGFLLSDLPNLPHDRQGKPVDPSIFWSTIARLPGCQPMKVQERLRIDRVTVGECIERAREAQLLRVLPAWPSSRSDRIPRLYLRDSGLAHRLTNIGTLKALTGVRRGASWEAFAIEALVGSAPLGTKCWLYRDADTDEIDLVLQFRARPKPWAIEIKVSDVPSVSRGFHRGALVIEAERRIAVYRGDVRVSLRSEVEGMSLVDAMAEVQSV